MKTHKKTGAIVCAHIAHQGADIRYARRDEPVVPEDSGWQFRCNPTAGEEAPQLWRIDEVLKADPSINAFIDSAPGVAYAKSSAGAWHRVVPEIASNKDQ